MHRLPVTIVCCRDSIAVYQPKLKRPYPRIYAEVVQNVPLQPQLSSDGSVDNYDSKPRLVINFNRSESNDTVMDIMPSPSPAKKMRPAEKPAPHLPTFVGKPMPPQPPAETTTTTTVQQEADESRDTTPPPPTAPVPAVPIKCIKPYPLKRHNEHRHCVSFNPIINKGVPQSSDRPSSKQQDLPQQPTDRTSNLFCIIPVTPLQPADCPLTKQHEKRKLKKILSKTQQRADRMSQPAECPLTKQRENLKLMKSLPKTQQPLDRMSDKKQNKVTLQQQRPDRFFLRAGNVVYLTCHPDTEIESAKVVIANTEGVMLVTISEGLLCVLIGEKTFRKRKTCFDGKTWTVTQTTRVCKEISEAPVSVITNLELTSEEKRHLSAINWLHSMYGQSVTQYEVGEDVYVLFTMNILICLGLYKDCGQSISIMKSFPTNQYSKLMGYKEIFGVTKIPDSGKPIYNPLMYRPKGNLVLAVHYEHILDAFTKCTSKVSKTLAKLMSKFFTYIIRKHAKKNVKDLGAEGFPKAAIKPAEEDLEKHLMEMKVRALKAKKAIANVIAAKDREWMKKLAIKDKEMMEQLTIKNKEVALKEREKQEQLAITKKEMIKNKLLAELWRAVALRPKLNNRQCSLECRRIRCFELSFRKITYFHRDPDYFFRSNYFQMPDFNNRTTIKQNLAYLTRDKRQDRLLTLYGVNDMTQTRAAIASVFQRLPKSQAQLVVKDIETARKEIQDNLMESLKSSFAAVVFYNADGSFEYHLNDIILGGMPREDADFLMTLGTVNINGRIIL